MEEQDQRARQLRAAVAKGFDQLERGASVELTSERIERIRQRAIVNARSGKPVKDAVTP